MLLRWRCTARPGSCLVAGNHRTWPGVNECHEPARCLSNTSRRCRRSASRRQLDAGWPQSPGRLTLRYDDIRTRRSLFLLSTTPRRCPRRRLQGLFPWVAFPGRSSTPAVVQWRLSAAELHDGEVSQVATATMVGLRRREGPRRVVAAFGWTTGLRCYIHAVWQAGELTGWLSWTTVDPQEYSSKTRSLL